MTRAENRLWLRLRGKRDEYLSRLGLQVIHYTNDDVLNNLEGVLEDLSMKLPS